MSNSEDFMGQAVQAAGVSNSDPCIVPLAPGNSDSQTALDELEAIQDTCSGEPCELDKPECKTDEFRLHQFKIKQCTNEEAHDWCLCPFAHPGEKAQRRDPRLYKYTGISCPDYRKGTCKRGNACPYAHGVFEVWLHPSRYRTQMCKDAPHCTRQVCFFAHTLEEVRAVEAEDLPLLLEEGAAADAELPAVPESASPPPKCGSNTNAKAAAAAKAKAAAAAAAAAQAAGSVSGASAASSSSASSTSGSSSGQGGGSSTSLTAGLTADPWMAAAAAGSGSFKGMSLMSRQASTCSTATTASQLGGLDTVASINSGLNAPALMQGAGGAAGVASIAAAAAAAAAAAGGGSRLLQVPSDIALEAAALRVAQQQQQQQLCDTFGSLDLGAFGAVGCGKAGGQWCAAAAAAASVGLPLQHLQLDAAGLGQHFGAVGDLAMAAAAHQAVAAQHAEMQAMLQAAMVHQQHLASMQRHRDAMWTAAYNAAAGVGLNAATAAACADAAVQSTTEAADAAAAAAARSQQQQQLVMQQLIASQQQQQQLAHQLAAVTAPMAAAGPGLSLQQQLQHAGSSFGVIGCGSPVPGPLNKLGSSGCLDLDHHHQQQQQMQLMQQAGALALHCEAFGGHKQLAGLMGHAQAQGGMMSVTAGCGGAFGGL